MTRKFIIFCVLCILAACCIAGAAADAARFTAGEFEAALPEGWQEGYSDGETAWYFPNTDFSLDEGVIILRVERSDLLSEDVLTDEFLREVYSAQLDSVASGAVDGKVDSAESVICGRPSLVYWYRMDADGVRYAVAENVTVTGTGLFEIMIIHPGMEPEELKDIAVSIGETVQYNVPGSAAAGLTHEDLPRSDDPYRFTPAFTAGEDLLPAQWMMDENTRALCTVYLTLDLVMDNMPLFEAFPMNVFESGIGLSDDTIRLLVRSQDGQTANIVVYNTAEQTALFYTEPWNEETLAAFEQTCPDQFYTNTAEGLEYANQYISGAFDGGE